MRNVRLITLLLGCLLAAMEPVLALELDDYPGARRVFSTTEKVSDYMLALGTYRKVGGIMRVEHQRLSGQLTRTTYELPDNHSAAQGFDYFLRQLSRYSLRELYRCSGRECGQSNHWANDHFEILQLYGLDQYQYYGAFELLDSEQRGVYVTLYGVLRGNRRVFVQVEVLQADDDTSYRVASAPEALLQQLLRDGYVSFLHLDETASDKTLLGEQHLDALAALLRQNDELKVILVGHNYESVAGEQRRARSKKMADSVSRALTARGVDPSRLAAEGVGGLAPAGRNGSRLRIDMILSPELAQ